MNKKAWVACLIFAVSLLAGGVLAGESREASLRGARPHKVILQEKVSHLVKSSLSPASGNKAPHALAAYRPAPEKVGRPQATKPAPPKKFIVAIDAGHGGKDTGAIGPKGTYEKDVVYAISRKLADMIRAEPDMRAVMVRRGDRFVGLRRRREIAQAAHADLFVSLHADAHVGEAASGSSVFTLARRTDSALADVPPHTRMASVQAARKVLGELRKKYHLHFHRVQKARFMVLKSPDVPSILVETGFISNPEEELKLASRLHQERIARSIFYGIRSFLPPRPVEYVPVRTAGGDKPTVTVAAR